jgi:hypothetical protein
LRHLVPGRFRGPQVQDRSVGTYFRNSDGKTRPVRAIYAIRFTPEADIEHL